MPKVKRRTGGRAGTRRLLSWSSLPWASLRTQHTVDGFSKQLIITPWEMQTLTPTLLTSASGRQRFLKMQRFHVQLTPECFLFSPAPNLLNGFYLPTSPLSVTQRLLGLGGVCAAPSPAPGFRSAHCLSFLGQGLCLTSCYLPKHSSAPRPPSPSHGQLGIPRKPSHHPQPTQSQVVREGSLYWFLL